MRYILDTENFKKLMKNPNELSAHVKSILEDDNNTVYVSNVSVLELKSEMEMERKSILNVDDIYEKVRILGLHLMTDHSEAKSLLFFLPQSKRCETLYRFLRFQASRNGMTLVCDPSFAIS